MRGGGVATKGVMPILSHVLIEATEAGVSFTGTDREMQITARLPLTPTAVGAVCVPGRVLTDVLSALPGKAEATVAIDGPYLEIRAGKATFSLVTLPADDFPRWPAFDGESLLLSGGTLQTLCRRAGFCAAGPKDGKALLEGMNLTGKGNALAAASTDSHRLAVMSLPMDVPEIMAILPERLVNELMKMAEPHAEVALTIGTVRTGDEAAPVLRAEMGGVTLTARLIAGQFPDWQRILPTDPPVRCVADRKTLMQALKRAAVVARVESGRVLLENVLGVLHLTAYSKDLGTAHEEVPVDDAVEWRTWFNIDYLLEALEVSTAERVTFAQNGTLAPLVILEDDPSWRAIVMPMQDL